MTPFAWLCLGLVVGVAAGLASARILRLGAVRRLTPKHGRRIVFPFVGTAITRRALDAAMRLAEAEHATLVPVYLARVPLHLPLDAALPRQAKIATDLLETIDQVASRRGIPVETRIERGRSVRHALGRLADHERFYRMVMATATREHDGLEPEDVAWALRYVPGEIVVLRPGDTPIANLPQHLTRSGLFANWLVARRGTSVKAVSQQA